MKIEKYAKYLKYIYLGLLFIFIFCMPILHKEMLADMCSDATIQIKIGMDSIEQGSIMYDEQYSWHEGLNWIPHETGWYWILGFLYKAFGLIGVIIFNALLNGVLGIIILSRIKNNSIFSITLSVFLLLLVGVPYFNARPHSLSIPLTILCFVLLRDGNKDKVNAIIFAIIMWVTSWVHGGMLPLLALSMIIFIVIDVIYADYRKGLIKGIGLICGFCLSLLNPIGVETWTYGLKVMNSEVNKHIAEWQPCSFNLPFALIIAIIFVLFCFNTNANFKNKKLVINIAFFCMFFIATCLRVRFIAYLIIIIALILPQLLDDIVNEIANSELRIKNMFNMKIIKVWKILEVKAGMSFIASIILVFLIMMMVKDTSQIISKNTMSDIFVMNDIDEKVVDEIKDRGYERVYNGYNDGSWLLFNDIPVNIDNRCDPYIKEISGKDYIVFQQSISNLEKSIEEGKADVILCSLVEEEQNDFIYYIQISDKYKKVYENKVGKKTWYLFEPLYLENERK